MAKNTYIILYLLLVCGLTQFCLRPLQNILHFEDRDNSVKRCLSPWHKGLSAFDSKLSVEITPDFVNEYSLSLRPPRGRKGIADYPYMSLLMPYKVLVDVTKKAVTPQTLASALNAYTASTDTSLPPFSTIRSVKVVPMQAGGEYAILQIRIEYEDATVINFALNMAWKEELTPFLRQDYYNILFCRLLLENMRAHGILSERASFDLSLPLFLGESVFSGIDPEGNEPYEYIYAYYMTLWEDTEEHKSHEIHPWVDHRHTVSPAIVASVPKYGNPSGTRTFDSDTTHHIRINQIAMLTVLHLGPSVIQQENLRELLRHPYFSPYREQMELLVQEMCRAASENKGIVLPSCDPLAGDFILIDRLIKLITVRELRYAPVSELLVEILTARPDSPDELTADLPLFYHQDVPEVVLEGIITGLELLDFTPGYIADFISAMLSDALSQAQPGLRQTIKTMITRFSNTALGKLYDIRFSGISVYASPVLSNTDELMSSA